MSTRYQIKARTMAALAVHPKVEECEDKGMDEDRFFLHLHKEWTWDDGDGVHQSRSFGNKREALTALAKETKAISAEERAAWNAEQDRHFAEVRARLANR